MSHLQVTWVKSRVSYFSCATVAASTFARRCNCDSLGQWLMQLSGNGKLQKFKLVVGETSQRGGGKGMNRMKPVFGWSALSVHLLVGVILLPLHTHTHTMRVRWCKHDDLEADTATFLCCLVIVAVRFFFYDFIDFCPLWVFFIVSAMYARFSSS